MHELLVYDPITEGLRDLVRRRIITGWKMVTAHAGRIDYLIVPAEGVSGTYTASSANQLIGMYWEVHGCP